MKHITLSANFKKGTGVVNANPNIKLSYNKDDKKKAIM